MTPALLALCLLAASPGDLPIVRQSAREWAATVRENGLPADAIGWVDWKRRVIVVAAGHPEEAATIVHERAHVEYQEALSPASREEWEREWTGWRERLPWRPARDRAAEAWAYLVEWLSPESRYVGSVPVEAVRLLLRLRGRERP